MVSNIQNIKKARELRLSGRSLSEISKELNISKSTVSNWLRDIVLSATQVQNLKSRVGNMAARGRLNASVIKKSNRLFREKTIYDEAVRNFPTLVKDSFFILGLSLYWAKGTIKGNYFQFTGSDAVMNGVIIKWISKYLKIDNNMIKQRSCGSYSKIYITQIDALRRVVAWQKLLIAYYSRILKGEESEGVL